VSRAAVVLALAAALTAGCGGAARDHRPPAVLAVEIRHATGSAGLATGIAAGGDRVVTVAHVLARAGDVRVRVAGRWRPARVVRRDARDDLVVLAAGGLDAPALRVADDEASARLLLLRDGGARPREVAALRRIHAGVEGFGPPGYRRPALELGAEVLPGDSGAPVLDAGGALLGVIFARSRGHEGTAYAIDAAVVRRLLARTTTPRD
jgi:S1-C subfamily serine protease